MKLPADCLDRIGRTAHDFQVALADDNHIVLLALPWIALIVAVLLAPWVLRAYSRRVQRYMGFRELRPPPSAWWARRAQRAAPGPRAHTAVALPLAEAVALRTRRLRVATAAAGCALLAGAALLAMSDPGTEAGGALGVVAFMGLMAFGLAQVLLQPDGHKHWLWSAGLLLLLAGLVAEHDASPDNLLIGVAVMGLLYAAGVHRTWRALCLPLAVLVLGVLVGLWVAALAMIPAVCLPPTDTPDALQTTAIMLILLGCVMALAGCIWASGRLLAGLEALMRRGWVSDLSLVAGSGAAWVLGLMLIGWDDASVPVAHKLAWGALWLLAVLAAYATALWCLPAPQQGRSLLMLRVFSKDRRAERLLDALQSRWRLAGPVLEIGGPDLAHLNLDLSEFIHFATGRTHELFQPGVVPAEVLAQSLQLTPDREGRFRVNEVFCFDSAWRGVVEQLLQLADGVLLDLRGFNAERSGTTFEVERLAALGLLPRVVAVGDADTDWAWFEARVAAASARPVAPLALRVDARAPGALPQCLAQLMAVSDTPRAG